MSDFRLPDNYYDGPIARGWDEEEGGQRVALIKVTGHIDPDNLEEWDLDPDHPTGLSEIGFQRMPLNLGLDDVDFEVVE